MGLAVLIANFIFSNKKAETFLVRTAVGSILHRILWRELTRPLSTTLFGLHDETLTFGLQVVIFQYLHNCSPIPSQLHATRVGLVLQ